MTIYRLAVRHAQLMLFATLAAFMFVITVDRWLGHSAWAFGVAVLMLIGFNVRIRLFNCPTCGKNLFFRGSIMVPWPNKSCGNCGTDLDTGAQ